MTTPLTTDGPRQRPGHRTPIPPDPYDPHRLVSPAELAGLWDVTRQHIYTMLGRGLPSITLGRCRRIRLGDAERWLDEQ